MYDLIIAVSQVLSVNGFRVLNRQLPGGYMSPAEYPSLAIIDPVVTLSTFQSIYRLAELELRSTIQGTNGRSQTFRKRSSTNVDALQAMNLHSLACQIVLEFMRDIASAFNLPFDMPREYNPRFTQRTEAQAQAQRTEAQLQRTREAAARGVERAAATLERMAAAESAGQVETRVVNPVSWRERILDSYYAVQERLDPRIVSVFGEGRTMSNGQRINEPIREEVPTSTTHTWQQLNDMYIHTYNRNPNVAIPAPEESVVGTQPSFQDGQAVHTLQETPLQLYRSRTTSAVDSAWMSAEVEKMYAKMWYSKKAEAPKEVNGVTYIPPTDAPEMEIPF